MERVLSDKIRNANVLMTLLIVMMHSTWAGTTSLQAMKTLGDSAVPVFFCISSFLYFRDWEPTLRSYTAKLASRARSLLVPFLLYSAVFTLWKFVAAHYMGRTHANDVPTDAVGLVFYILRCNSNGPMWYIRELMVFVAVAPLIGLIIKRSRLAVVLFFVCGGLLCHTDYDSLPYWLPCIALGCHCALHSDDAARCAVWLSRLPRAVPAIAAALFFIASCIVFDCEADRASAYYYAYRMAVPFFVILAYARYTLIPDGVCRRFAPYTFFIYCTHFIVTGTLSAILLRRMWGEPDIVIWAIVVGITLLLCTSFGMVLRRFPSVWRPLNGFRRVSQ